jgi:hypothetical protein
MVLTFHLELIFEIIACQRNSKTIKMIIHDDGPHIAGHDDGPHMPATIMALTNLFGSVEIN